MHHAAPVPEPLRARLALLLFAALGASLLSEYADIVRLPHWAGPAVALATALAALCVSWHQRAPRGRYVYLFMSAQAGAALAGSVLGS